MRVEHSLPNVNKWMGLREYQLVVYKDRKENKLHQLHFMHRI